MSQDQHFDVAAYALGVLDERDSARFEEHLIDCSACAVELESFLPVADVLAEIDADSVVATEQSRRDGVVLRKVIGAVHQERRRAQHRRLYSLAAAVVAVAALSVGALFAGGEWLAPPPSTGALEPTRPSLPDGMDPLPPANPGIGGTDLKGELLGGTDPRTSVRADVALQPKDWGTQVSFAVSNVKGPLTCRLVAVRTNGELEVLSTWAVGEQGWGTAAQPKPLLLQAATALPRKEIAHVQVQAIDANGVPETLVRVP
ncbi:MAG TPA: zf-HC2 domain-containing protein [Actinoplanes sp.]|nr:zf-HC2 domain-containing protein [Actinoplanes sp.]